MICSNFESGLHSFTVIGSYGTGKSAFIVALEKHLSGEHEYFEPLNGHFNGCKEFEFLNIVGEKESFLQALSQELRVEATPKSLIRSLEKKQKALSTKGACLVVVIDEFGKFLEYAASVDPDRELYFIQQLAEFVNDEQKNILLITTLHQNFDAYAVGLTEAQRKELISSSKRLERR